MHHTLCIVQTQLPVIICLASRRFCLHSKLHKMNPFSTQLAHVVQCLMRLHLGITNCQ